MNCYNNITQMLRTKKFNMVHSIESFLGIQSDHKHWTTTLHEIFNTLS